MQNVYSFILWLFVCLLGIAPAKAAIDLKLQDAYRLVEDVNPRFKDIEYTSKLERLQFEGIKDNYYLPTISLFASEVVSPFTFYQLPGSDDRKLGESVETRGYPSTTILGIAIEEYPIFDFWQRAKQFEMDEIDYGISKRRVVTDKRELRFRLIELYFLVWAAQRNYEAAQRNARETKVILDLINTSFKNKRSSSEDLAAAQFDYQLSKNFEKEQKEFYDQSCLELGFFIGYEQPVAFNIPEDFPFFAINMTSGQLQALINNSPSYERFAAELKRTSLAVENEERLRIPLPTISVSAATWSTNSLYSTKTESASTSDGAANGNINLEVKLNYTLPLTGRAGLFNNRAVEIARANHFKTIASNETLKKDLIFQTYSLYKVIKKSEEQIADLSKSLLYSQTLIQRQLSQLVKGGSARYEVKVSLQESNQLQTALNNAYLVHLTSKLNMARLLGIDQVPGDKLCELLPCL